ncbi:hypothetical protein SAMN03097708_03116 [Thiohalomonas denitrificans]|uniref:Uncharacterized protein n=1 Tax=Thiohalomonas denitrificans TaxID=415747 RepID=A0A1G5R1E1_9GAMM|nr:hypothetical protein SAMN03097708_03116 [Thiohalomonas denitrificans]
MAAIQKCHLRPNPTIILNHDPLTCYTLHTYRPFGIFKAMILGVKTHVLTHNDIISDIHPSSRADKRKSTNTRVNPYPAANTEIANDTCCLNDGIGTNIHPIANHHAIA